MSYVREVGLYTTNASTFPSGDQDGANCQSALVASRSAGALRFAGLQNRFGGPPVLLEENVTRAPSGVQLGQELSPCTVSRVKVSREMS